MARVKNTLNETWTCEYLQFLLVSEPLTDDESGQSETMGESRRIKQ